MVSSHRKALNILPAKPNSSEKAIIEKLADLVICHNSTKSVSLYSNHKTTTPITKGNRVLTIFLVTLKLITPILIMCSCPQNYKIILILFLKWFKTLRKHYSVINHHSFFKDCSRGIIRVLLM